MAVRVHSAEEERRQVEMFAGVVPRGGPQDLEGKRIPAESLRPDKLELEERLEADDPRLRQVVAVQLEDNVLPEVVAVQQHRVLVLRLRMGHRSAYQVHAATRNYHASVFRLSYSSLPRSFVSLQCDSSDELGLPQQICDWPPGACLTFHRS